MRGTFLYTLIGLLLFSCKPKPEEIPVKHTGDLTLQLSPNQEKLANIGIDTVETRPFGEAVVMFGMIETDQNRVSVVSTRVMGRIDKLYVKAAGEPVKKGQLLYELFSEELSLAISELLLSGKRLDGVQGNPEFGILYESSRNRLKLYGISEEQIKKWEAEGMIPGKVPFYSSVSGFITRIDVAEGSYVMEGNPVIEVTDLSQVWTEIQIYPGELKHISKGSEIIVRIPGNEKHFKGRVHSVSPEIKHPYTYFPLRVEIPNPGYELKPGMQALVSVLKERRNVIAIPSDAIIHDSKGSTVWLKTGPGTYSPRMVHAGSESSGFTEVTHGLDTGEVIVITGAYLLNSEFIIRHGQKELHNH